MLFSNSLISFANLSASFSPLKKSVSPAKDSLTFKTCSCNFKNIFCIVGNALFFANSINAIPITLALLVSLSSPPWNSLAVSLDLLTDEANAPNKNPDKELNPCFAVSVTFG